MAPGLHPPCTPASSCQPFRCHPTAPPCKSPLRCLRKTTRKGVAPCKSAVSIMSTRAKSRCGTCGMFYARNVKNPRSQRLVIRYLRQKRRERRLLKWDNIRGTRRFIRYQRRKGTRRLKEDCCAGHGHRGRLKRGRRSRRTVGPIGKTRCCTIL